MYHQNTECIILQAALKLYKSIVLLVHIQINMELYQFQWLWFKYDVPHW